MQELLNGDSSLQHQMIAALQAQTGDMQAAYHKQMEQIRFVTSAMASSSSAPRPVPPQPQITQEFLEGLASMLFVMQKGRPPPPEHPDIKTIRMRMQKKTKVTKRTGVHTRTHAHM